MADPYEIGVQRRATGDHFSDWLDTLAQTEQKRQQLSPLDSDRARRIHQKLLAWYYFERNKQAENRMEMAVDADFYDNMQWDPEDAAELERRGQMPLVFNEVAPMVDWIIGTERRTRVDWRVLPRTEDDVQLADAKTKTLKYVGDINRIPFNRSRAFTDSAKVGVGWLDDGARDDPTQDVIYDRYEDWRNVLWDSAGYDLDLYDARYTFRWRWVDDDVALTMFPDRQLQILRSLVDTGTNTESELDSEWYLGERIVRSGSMFSSGNGVYSNEGRSRIRLIEAQFRLPAKVQIIADGPLKGSFLHPNDLALMDAARAHGSEIIEKVVMRVHVAVFTETSMLSLGPSIYRHNRFSLTPIWCYRRGRDRLPYGAIRRVRDIQMDMNKRASKALFLFSTNQIIAEKGAVDDKAVAREEADMPDGWIEVNAKKEFKIQRDAEQATGQIQMMTLDAQAIQRTAGVNNENLGRQTNAVSGEAIKARQLQGSVGTTEPFDNLRYAVQVQGEKLLSLVEQFYTEEKVIRLTGAKPGQFEWLRINQPERQPDGSVRYLNDITASAADFVVSEADYAGTLRQVMFEGINAMAQRLPPELAIRLFIIAMEFSDQPNKDEIADAMRQVIGERDPNKPMTQEEAAQMQEQMAAQADAMRMQREMAQLSVDEKRAQVEKINAEVQGILAKSQGSGNGLGADFEVKLRQVQEQAARELEAVSDKLRQVQTDSARQIMQLRQDADVRTECTRIESDAKIRVAEINSVAKESLDNIHERIAEIAKAVDLMTPTAKGGEEGGQGAS